MIPKDLLTNQGMHFISKLMGDLCWLLQIKHLQTSSYHPQTNGLVKHFGQTLKRMIDKEGWDGDLLLSYVLFASWKTPQAGFTTFELLFSRKPRGLLDIIKYAWEKQTLSYKSLIEYVQQMQEVTHKVMQIIREHLQAAQTEQCRIYNHPAQLQEFKPGNCILLLLLSTNCKFLACGHHWESRPSLSHAQVDLIQLEMKNPPGIVICQWPYKVPVACCQAIEEGA